MPDLSFDTLRAAWRHHRRFFLVAYGIAGGVLFSAVLVAHVTKRGTLYLFGDLLRIREQPGAGLFTLVSAFCLAAAAVLVLLRPSLGRGPSGALPSGAERWGWWGVGAGLFLLAFDEVLMIHEQLSDAMEAAGVPRIGGVIEQDTYIFALYGVGAVLLSWVLRHTLARQPEVGLALIAMAVCWGLSQSLDMIPFHDLNRVQQRSLGPMEEGFKVLGSWSVLLAAILLVRGAVSPADSGPEADPER